MDPPLVSMIRGDRRGTVPHSGACGGGGVGSRCDEDGKPERARDSSSVVKYNLHAHTRNTGVKRGKSAPCGILAYLNRGEARSWFLPNVSGPVRFLRRPASVITTRYSIGDFIRKQS